MDRLLSTTDPLGEITSYVYNTSGKVIQTTDPNGNRVTYTYDLRNLLTIMQYADGFKELNAYDADRNRVQQTRRNSQSRTLTYDSRNRVAGWSWTDSTPAVTLGYGDGIGDAGFNFLVHREIERGDEGGQSDENEIVIFGELLKQKAQFSEGRRPRPYGSLL
jgi:YD repeat-containing protein